MNKADTILSCYHCGHEVPDKTMAIQGKYFCCAGCKMVYEIISGHDLCVYYELNEKPGVVQNRISRKEKYAFLDDADVARKLIQFSSAQQSQVTFYLPQIHCSSCLWLLENLHKVNGGILSSRVNFVKKEVFIAFDPTLTSLRKIVETLDGIGYEPHLSLNEISSEAGIKTDRTRWYKIGVAGFCFSNIMMMSFADYLAIFNTVDARIAFFLKTFIVVLSLPVLFYSATEFFTAAWNGLKNRYLNIDFPVALALVITFVRSLYEITSGTGGGYLDSMSGIVFFMLIGRWLQERTNQTIAFDRDYKSFFPIALNVVKNGQVTPVEISKVKINDVIRIYSHEIIPVDAMVSKGKAKIDYSFVTGESLPVPVNIGEIVYAGGKQMAGLLELIVVKEVSQGYLTNLWNNPVFKRKETPKKSTYDLIGKYFTYAVLAMGLVSGIYWYSQGEHQLMWNALTTVLIVACPCALLLAENYTSGNILRIFGLNKFYLRSAEMIEKLSEIHHIVLDKTGTLTEASEARVAYKGRVLPDNYRRIVAALLRQSSHPLCKLTSSWLNEKDLPAVVHYKEVEGQGIEGWAEEHHIKLGSPEFVGTAYSKEKYGAKIVVFIDGDILGEFVIANKYRPGISGLLQALKKKYTLSLLSGDNDTELGNIRDLIGSDSEVFFNQSPQQKLEHILRLQKHDQASVMMIGDGLNDAGALKQSDLGIAVADSGNNFTPGCDGIIDASRLIQLDAFLQYAITGKKIILFTFALSAIYNIIGLYYAIQGILSPVIAAILMPCSSITIILLTYGLTQWAARRHGLAVAKGPPGTSIN